MRHDLFLPIFDALSDPVEVTRLSAEAEEAGWDGVFVWDHVVYKEPVKAVADPWITLAAMAVATERIRIGPMVTPLPRRRPAMVARETATLDRLSGGRLTLGVGIGGDGYRELSGTGDETDARVRAAMLDESLEILRALWTGERVDHHGPHYTLDGLQFLPTPVQGAELPVWVAVRYGNTKPLARAARHEGVFPVNLEEPAQLEGLVAEVEQLRAAHGRAGTPFDVVFDGPPGMDRSGYEAAGATWSLVTFDYANTSVDVVRSVLREGPPR